VVDGSGALVESANVRTDEQISSWLGRHASSLVTVAVDAPLIVLNATGMRPAKKLVGASFGKYDASCHASNTSKAYMHPPRATTLAQRHGWSVDPAHVGSAEEPACIEVYPHPATIGLFGLGRILKYKGGELGVRRVAFIILLDHIEAIPTLGLGSNDRWAEIRSVASNSPRQFQLDQIEDEVDAVLCAHLAWLWHTDCSALQVYGDVEAGYIVAPPPPTHPATPRTRVDKPAQRHTSASSSSVTLTVEGNPATFSTAGEQPWRAAVTAAARLAMLGAPPLEGRLSVELDFVLPEPMIKGQGWDLDNLIKPTIDALGPVIGIRPGKWKWEQVDDERVDRIVATKRAVRSGEAPARPSQSASRAEELTGARHIRSLSSTRPSRVGQIQRRQPAE
jgi:predicted RNase H-like nuclease/Holliday junction resolvase RusA-like endonuclease